MQAGRELDAKVAEALGYTRREEPIFDDGETINGYVIGDRWYSHIPGFSTTWEGMGVLMEEARKQGIYLAAGGFKEGYMGEAWVMHDKEYINSSSVENITAPAAVCMAFIQSKAIAN